MPFQDGMFPWGKEVDGPSNTVRPHPTLCFRRVLIPCRCCRGLRFQSSGTLTPSRTSLSLSRMASSGGITLASTCPHPVNAWRRFWLLSGGHLMLLCRGGIVISSLFCPSTHTTLASYTICTYFIPAQILNSTRSTHTSLCICLIRFSNAHERSLDPSELFPCISHVGVVLAVFRHEGVEGAPIYAPCMFTSHQDRLVGTCSHFC